MNRIGMAACAIVVCFAVIACGDDEGPENQGVPDTGPVDDAGDVADMSDMSDVTSDAGVDMAPEDVGTDGGVDADVDMALTRFELTLQINGSGSGTVASTPQGLSCSDGCTAAFDSGTSVDLRTTAGTNSTFVAFSGDGDCEDGNITLDGDTTCIATFAVLPADPCEGYGADGIAWVDDGEQEMSTAIRLLDDGSTVITGASGDGDKDALVTRVSSSGTVDSTFGTNGFTTVDFGGDDRADFIDIAVDGDILTLGRSDLSNASRLAIARFEPDGQPDTGFDTDGALMYDLANESLWPAGIHALSGGGMIITGAVGPDCCVVKGEIFLLKLAADGTTDASFGTDGLVRIPLSTDTSVHHSVMQADGRIVLVGKFDGGTSWTARINADGTLDTTYASDGVFELSNFPWARRIALDANGNALVTGYTGLYSVNTAHGVMARVKPDGTYDANFGNAGVVEGPGVFQPHRFSVAVEAGDGSIFVPGTPSDFMIAKYNADGTIAGGFGTNGYATANLDGVGGVVEVAVTPDGKLLQIGRSDGNIVIGCFGR